MKVIGCLGGLLLASAISGCGGDSGVVACRNPTAGTEGKNVANTLTLPTGRNDFPYDLIGDGKIHNALGNILGAIASMTSLKPQAEVDAAIMTGKALLLL